MAPAEPSPPTMVITCLWLVNLLLLQYITLKTVHCERVELSSSVTGDVVCGNDHVVFYCNATETGTSLFWFLGTTIIHTQRSTDVETTRVNMESGTYAALFPNTTGNNELESELIFIRLPTSNHFEVMCSSGGQDKTRSLSILRDSLVAVEMEDIVEMAPNIVYISWKHSRPSMVQYYRLSIDNVTVTEVRNRNAVIFVRDCNEGEAVNATITPVDVCGRKGMVLAVSILRCSSNSTTPPPATTMVPTSDPYSRSLNEIKAIVAVLLAAFLLFCVILVTIAVIYVIKVCFCSTKQGDSSLKSPLDEQAIKYLERQLEPLGTASLSEEKKEDLAHPPTPYESDSSLSGYNEGTSEETPC